MIREGASWPSGATSRYKGPGVFDAAGDALAPARAAQIADFRPESVGEGEETLHDFGLLRGDFMVFMDIVDHIVELQRRGCGRWLAGIVDPASQRQVELPAA